MTKKQNKPDKVIVKESQEKDKVNIEVKVFKVKPKIARVKGIKE